jgi:peptide/nickel transport system substrate-binding protein
VPFSPDNLMLSDGRLAGPTIPQKACRMWLHRLVAGLLLAVFSTLTGPVRAQTTVLHVVPHADLTLLDPAFAPILITREYGLMIYEELFAWDSQLQPKP